MIPAPVAAGKSINDVMVNNEYRIIGRIIAVLFTIVAMVSTIYGMLAFIDSRIDKVTKDEAFLRRVVSALRPTIIFDQKGTVLYDSGALELINDIRTKPMPKDSLFAGLPRKIIISPKKFLSQAPILTPIDSVSAVITCNRSGKLDWEYNLDYASFAQSGPGQIFRFRLEVLP